MTGTTGANESKTKRNDDETERNVSKTEDKIVTTKSAEKEEKRTVEGEAFSNSKEGG